MPAPAIHRSRCARRSTSSIDPATARYAARTMAKGAEAAGEIVQRIQRAYPKATYALEWSTPFELLVGTILAAQSTDAVVNKITPALFAKYRDARGFAAADPAELAELIRPCGIH